MKMEATKNVAVAMFLDHLKARAAIRELRDAGFSEEQIGVAARNTDSASRQLADDEIDCGKSLAASSGVGIAAGAGVGVLWALGVAGGFLPGIGHVIAGGLLAAVTASAAGGAAIASLVGSLAGLGLSDEEAAEYEAEFKAGSAIVTVKADNRYQEALAILRRHGGIFNARIRQTLVVPASN